MQENGKELTAAKSRTGHGAASVIPHLNNLFPLEPSQLSDPAIEDLVREDPVVDEEPADAPRGL